MAVRKLRKGEKNAFADSLREGWITTEDNRFIRLRESSMCSVVFIKILLNVDKFLT